MVDEVKSYGNGNWLMHKNANAKVTENKKHGVATNYQDKNDEAYNAFDKLLNDDNNNSSVTIFVSNRTEKNDKGKALAGLSYDLADMFMKAAEQGLICDEDGEGFTRADAEALGKKIAELDGKGDNYMDDTFRNMGVDLSPKDRRIYTREQIFTLMKAAGYKRYKAFAPLKAEQITNPEPINVDISKIKLPEIKVPEGNERYSNMGLLNTKQILENGLAKAGVVKDGESVCIDFKGDLNPDETGEYAKKGKFTIKVSDDPKTKAHDLPDEYANKAKYKIKNGKMYMSIDGIHRKGNIFHKREWQEVGPVDFTPNMEAAQDVEGAK